LVTFNDVNVPTDVMLGCAAVVTVPAVVALVAVPAEAEYVALATVPVTFAPGILVNPDNNEPGDNVQLPVIVPGVVFAPVLSTFPLNVVALPVKPTLPTYVGK
jgi:hypothetical protein